MRGKLTKFLTILLTFMLVVGMSPATGSTAYAASRWSGGSSVSSWFSGLFGKTNKGNTNTETQDKDSNTQTVATENSTSDDTGTVNDIKLTKTATANGVDKDGNPLFNIELGVQGKEVEKGAPADFTLVVDLSNSMNNNSRLSITKDAAIEFINTVLADGIDNVRVAIVAYGTMGHAYNFTNKSWDLYGSTSKDGYYTSSRTDALAVINSNNFAPSKLSPTGSGSNYTTYESGGTNTEGGFLTAQAVTATRNNADASSVVVFMTDGVPTYHYSDGTTVTGGGSSTELADFNEAVEAGKNLKAAGNTIYTVGLLTGYETDSDDMEMANKLLADDSSYSYGTTSSYSYQQITYNTTNSNYYDNTSNLWIKNNDGNYYKVKVDRTGRYNNYTYTYSYEDSGETIKTSSGSRTNPGLTLFTRSETTSNGYTPNGAAYSKKYYPVTDSDTAKTEIVKIYGDIAKENLVLATGNIVDYIPAGFEVVESSLEASGGVLGTDENGNKTVTFSGVPAGTNKETRTLTVKYVGDKYGVAYTNTKATYSGKLYDKSDFSKDFPLPVVGLNPKTEDDEYYLDANTDSQLDIWANDKLQVINDDDYTISDLQIALSNVPADVTATTQKNTDGKWEVVFNGPAGDYEFNYVLTATATITNESEGVPANEQDGWNDGKTEFTITSRVTNVKVHIVAAANKAYVIDFDKPVKYTDAFTAAEKKATITLNGATNNVKSGSYGDMTLSGNGDSITYKLTKFMNGVDEFSFNEDYEGKKSLTKTISMIPATSVYYDDSFTSETPGEGIVYSDNWEAIVSDQANKELQDAAQGLDANYGYDSSYDDFIGNSNGTVHKVTAEAANSATASITFTGTGIDVYALTNQTGGKVYAKLYDSEGTLKKTLIREYSYLTGELFHVPVISYNNLSKDTYRLDIIIAKGSTFYLDGLRIYNPLGTVIDELPDAAKEAYEADKELGAQFVSIRDGILGNSSIIKKVEGTVYIDKYASVQSETGWVEGHNNTLTGDVELDEYNKYGCKTETYLPAGKSLTLTLDQDYSNIQLGLKASMSGAKYTINDGEEKQINSSTDMYYKVSANNKTIKITNTSDAMLEITSLKVVK